MEFDLLGIIFSSHYMYSFSCMYHFLCMPSAPTEQPVMDPCKPSPCGPFSQCRVVNGHAVCSCQANYVGTPPSCKPECVVSTECVQDKACVNQRCMDPCPGTCGLNARCQVVNHNPICSCGPGFTGDPFTRCLKEESKNIHLFHWIWFFVFWNGFKLHARNLMVERPLQFDNY